MTEQKYAISKYPNVEEINAAFDRLIAQPMHPVKRDKMEVYLKYFEDKCKASKKLTDQAKKFIPGGVQHNLAFNYPFPIAIKKAKGAHLWDADDNKYIDFLQAGGPTVLGSNYEPVQAKVIELIKDCGPVTGLFHEYELKLAELINRHMPAVEIFRMLGSGTEGVLGAIRAARVFTGKRKVIKAGGAYHGWSDQMVFGLHVALSGPMEAHGIPAGCYADTQEFFPTDLGSLRTMLEANAKDGGTAAIIVEPVGPESGTRPVPFDYNKKVRELCDEFGALLIFDEVVTGFRLGLGGAQGYFGVKPDLTVFGKCVAGGYPAAGGLGGSAKVMERLAAGLEAGKTRAYVGGTLSANPLSCVAGYHAIMEMERTNAPVKAGQAGDKMTAGLQKLIAKHKLPFVVFNQGSICHFETSAIMLMDVRKDGKKVIMEAKPRKHMMEEMGAALMAEGIITLAGSRLYTSMADTDEVIESALGSFDRLLANVGPAS
jgi:glutamate-1-semialdehyde 2,1-aminomutase